MQPRVDLPVGHQRLSEICRDPSREQPDYAVPLTRWPTMPCQIAEGRPVTRIGAAFIVIVWLIVGIWLAFLVRDLFGA
jgi:hypothetical protein